jgi:hypothetical protein
VRNQLVKVNEEIIMSKEKSWIPVVHPLIKAMEESKESMVEIHGFFGTSKNENETVRLYDALDASSYMEIPKDAVLYMEPLEGDELGKIRVFVLSSQSIKLVHHMLSSEVISRWPVIKRTPDFWSCARKCEDSFASMASRILIERNKAFMETNPRKQRAMEAAIKTLETTAKSNLFICLNECATKYDVPLFWGPNLEKFSTSIYQQHLVNTYL